MTGRENKPTTRVEIVRQGTNTSGGSAANDRARRIKAAVEILAESFTKSVTPLTIRAYDVGTADLPIEAVEAAVMIAIKDRKFMATVAEIRELAGVMSPDVRATKAWLTVKMAVPVWGAYRSVSFDDPLVNAVVRALGGWVQVCETPSGEKTDTWLRKNFETTYKSLLASGVSAEQAAPLHGLCAIANGASGHEGPEIVRIACNLPPHAKRLIHEEQKPDGRSVGYLGAEANKIGQIE